MKREEKMKKCEMFFYALAEELEDYEVVGSCNRDASAYLVPLGTANEITYSSKPAHSFRISDHWNWYANLKKCENPRYIQCWSVDLPYPKPRDDSGRATKPVMGIQVAMADAGGKYHVIFGEKFDKRHKKWTWIDANPKEIAAMI